MIPNKSEATFLISIAILSCLVSAAEIEAADSTCFGFSGTSRGETIQLERGYILGGMLPVTLCGIERGAAYRMKFEAPNYETRIGVFKLDGERASIEGVGLRLAMRNAFVPGWGSANAGHLPAASLDIVALAAVGSILVGEQREYEHLNNRLENFKKEASRAESIEQYASALQGEHETIRHLNLQNAHRKRLLALGAAIYGWQAIEPMWNDLPPKTKRAEGSSLVILGSERSRAKAFARSLFYPGRGQFYQGKTVRGIAFSAISLAAGLSALEFHDRYEEACCDYELCLERFNEASSVEEKKELAERCAAILRDADSQKNRRTVSLAILAAAWSLGCIDTFWDSQSAPGNLSFEIGMGSAEIAFEF